MTVASKFLLFQEGKMGKKVTKIEWKDESTMLLEKGAKHAKKGRCAAGWSIFFICVGMLLVTGVVVMEMFLINGQPIYDIADNVVPVLFLIGAAFNLLALITAAVAKRQQNLAVKAFYNRSELKQPEKIAPVYVKMV